LEILLPLGTLVQVIFCDLNKPTDKPCPLT
jgi:hypothetical protein